MLLLNEGLAPNDAAPPNAGELPKEGGLPNTGALPNPPAEGKSINSLKKQKAVERCGSHRCFYNDIKKVASRCHCMALAHLHKRQCGDMLRPLCKYYNIYIPNVV